MRILFRLDYYILKINKYIKYIMVIHYTEVDVKELFDSEGIRVSVDNVRPNADIVLSDIVSEGLRFIKFERASNNSNVVVIETIIKHK